MKKVGYLITGLALGLTISVASPVVASTVKTISAKINNSVGIALNGEKIKLSTQPIEYNNLNYLPVGEIGRALGLEVDYDKSKNTINITSQDKTSTTNTTPPQTSTPPSSTDVPSNPTPTADTVQTAKIGEPITKDGVTVSIDKIEYMPEGEVIDGIHRTKGFKLFVTFTNNNDTFNLTSLGGTFNFKTDSFLDDKKVNGIGNSILLTVDGNKMQGGGNLEKGQTATGYLYYEIDRDINIKEITYIPVYDQTQQSKPLGTWTVE